MTLEETLGTLEPGSAGWSATVGEDWLQGRTVFGGLQVALGVRALRGLVGPAPPLRSLQATFVAPLPPGRILVAPRVLRTGKSVVHVACELRSATGELTTTLVAILGASRASAFAWPLAATDVPVDPETLTDMALPFDLTPRFAHHFRMRWARGTPLYTGYHEPHTVLLARMIEPSADAEATLIALSDCVPSPAASMLKRPAPVSSLNWMLEFITDPAGLDAADWCAIDTFVRNGTDGYGSQTSLLRSAGRALSVSHQTIGVFA
jgi:acyl-CoA thioesterase